VSTLSTAYAADRLAKESPAWSLLRGRNAGAAVALLGTHLGGEERRRPAPELFELIDADLQELRDHGFELPQTARTYCSEWRNEGILIRRVSEEARGETFELSPGDLDSHGFGILNRIRASCTDVSTVLMDVETLEAHRDLWVEEPLPSTGIFSHLLPVELKVVEELRSRGSPRLEQERIEWKYALERLLASAGYPSAD
jgi:hypothetical protein